MSASLSSLKELFSQQSNLIDDFFENLELRPIEEFCKEVTSCEGTVIFCGVGKSGFIAKKVCMTLVSTGTKSLFLNPTDALHGDIGILSKDDVLVLLSKSGSTQELINLIPYAKAKGAKIYGVTSNKDSKIAQMSYAHVYLPLRRELCPFDLAPVTSTAIQMLFGDTCAIAIMCAKSFSQEDFAMNHPAGRIGKRLVLTVSEVMIKRDELPLVTPSNKGMKALVSLAGSSKGCGCLLVVDELNKLLGTFSDSDLRRALADKGGDVLSLSVKELMNYKKSFPRVISVTAKAVDAQQKMECHPPVTYLPVVEGPHNTLVGLVTLHGLTNTGL